MRYLVGFVLALGIGACAACQNDDDCADAHSCTVGTCESDGCVFKVKPEGTQCCKALLCIPWDSSRCCDGTYVVYPR